MGACQPAANVQGQPGVFLLHPDGDAWGTARGEALSSTRGTNLNSRALSKMLFTTWGHTWLSVGALWSFQEEGFITDQKEPLPGIG